MGMSITSQKNFNIMSAKEKEAAAKQTFPFLALLTSEYSAKQNAERVSANLRVRVEGRTVLAQSSFLDFRMIGRTPS